MYLFLLFHGVLQVFFVVDIGFAAIREGHFFSEVLYPLFRSETLVDVVDRHVLVLRFALLLRALAFAAPVEAIVETTSVVRVAPRRRIQRRRPAVVVTGRAASIVVGGLRSLSIVMPTRLSRTRHILLARVPSRPASALGHPVPVPVAFPIFRQALCDMKRDLFAIVPYRA